MEWEDFTRDSIYKISDDKKVRFIFEEIKDSKIIGLSLKSKKYKDVYNSWFGKKPAEKLYNAIFCLLECPKCECGKDVSFEGFSRGYRTFCSGKCAQNSLATRTKLGDTLFEKYGTRDPLEINDGRKRGIAFITSKENFDKQAISNIEKFGGKTSFSCKKVQEKCKQTNIERYGVENLMFSEEFIENSFKKILKEKRIPTFIERYGETHPMKNKDVLQRMKKTNEESGKWLKDEDLEPFKLYIRNVWRYTKMNDLSILENIENRSREGYHLDHKYSIFQGYKDNIPAEIIGNICNLEMLPSGQNLSKNRSCSITESELLSSYEL